MSKPDRILRIVIGVFAGFAFIGSLGTGCAGITLNGQGLPDFVSDDNFVSDDTVLIELVNITEFPVDPGLFVAEDEDDLLDGDFLDEEKLVEIDPPVQPGEIVSVEIDCDEAGAIITDALLLVSDEEEVISDNAPLLLEDLDFVCGDIVSFIFAEDQDGFFTAVEVNDEPLLD